VLGIAGQSLVQKEQVEGVQGGRNFSALFAEPTFSAICTGWERKPNLDTWNSWPVLFHKSNFKESREEVILGSICRTYIICHLYRLGT
jgi:hypothetical protein